MTNRQLFTWFIRILVDSLHFIERIMDKVHHCLLILTSRLSEIYSQLHVQCPDMNNNKKEPRRKFRKILALAIQTGGLYVYVQTIRFVRADVLPNICKPTCQLNYQGICTWIDLLGKLNIYLTLCFFTISHLHYSINYVV